jgi:uncharacterized protein (TIGR03435 family)
MRIATRSLLLTLTLIWAQLIWAQSARPPRFEVAIIKPAPDCTLTQGVRLGQISPGRLDVECAIVSSLIGGAYSVDEHLEKRRVQIEGGPAWIKSEKVAITAKSEDGKASVAMMLGPMMQALLEERLAVKTHLETREGPVYELVVAKGGLKATPSAPGSCVKVDLASPPQDQHPDSPTYKNCGGTNRRTRNGMVWQATGVTMAEVARFVSFDRETFNRTNIEGKFDFTLRYSLPAAPGQEADPGVEHWPEIFTAIGDIGLKIVPARGPVQYVIIDSVQRPTDN